MSNRILQGNFRTCIFIYFFEKNITFFYKDTFNAVLYVLNELYGTILMNDNKNALNVWENINFELENLTCIDKNVHCFAQHISHGKLYRGIRKKNNKNMFISKFKISNSSKQLILEPENCMSFSQSGWYLD